MTATEQCRPRLLLAFDPRDQVADVTFLSLFSSRSYLVAPPTNYIEGRKRKKRKEDKRERSLKFAKNCFSFLLPSIFNSRIVVVNSCLIFEFSFLFGLKVERFRDQLMLF